uniref:Uncharacterized protein n=1 Tax=Arundo donax TaxID=35708 RepID=A0A0A8ZV21_ARUDO
MAHEAVWYSQLRFVSFLYISRIFLPVAQLTEKVLGTWRSQLRLVLLSVFLF